MFDNIVIPINHVNDPVNTGHDGYFPNQLDQSTIILIYFAYIFILKLILRCLVEHRKSKLEGINIDE